MTLEERVAAIDARQADHQMHDPDCNQRRADKANAEHGWGVIGHCDCWLLQRPPVEPENLKPSADDPWLRSQQDGDNLPA